MMKGIKGKSIGFILAVIGVFVLFISLGQIAPKGKDDKTIAKEFEVLGQLAPEEKLEKLEDYRKINEDVEFLLRYEDNLIPIVNTRDNERYFRLSIYGEYDSMGTPFIDEVSSANSDNIIIQGHSSNKNDFLFSFIGDITENSNDTFELISTSNERAYKIIGIALIDLTIDSPWLGYYQQEFRGDEKKQLVEDFLERSYLINEHDAIDEGSRLLTLVTCDVAKEDARFILLAKEEK